MTALFASVLTLLGTQWMCPAHFAPLPEGWVQGTLGASTVSANSWAHTPGFSNLNDIPGSGIYVWTLLNPRQPTSPAPTARESLRLPLVLAHAAQVTTQEGSSLPEYRFAGRYRGYLVDVRVDFGRQHPAPLMRGRVDALLARLRLPARIVAAPSACHG
jgi:hypothetical protein